MFVINNNKDNEKLNNKENEKMNFIYYQRISSI